MMYFHNSTLYGVSKLLNVRNEKTSRLDLNKQISHRGVDAEVQVWGNRGHCWVWRMKTLHWLESSLPVPISSNMCRYTNAELADMHFICEAKEEIVRIAHIMYVQELSILSKNYPQLCIILLPLQGFCDVFQVPYHASKHKTTQGRT